MTSDFSRRQASSLHTRSFFRSMPHGLMALLVLMGAQWAEAQVRVVDSQPVQSSRSQSGGASGSGYNAAANGLYNQLEMLRQEVLQLRGLVEQQAFELKRLKQQRMDDYMDIDRRLSQLTQGGLSANPPSAEVPQTGLASSVLSSSSKQDERQLYRGAIDALLKKKDMNTASQQLSTYLVDFPQGLYAPNAKYWLGEIYLIKGELESSKDWFQQLLSDHSDHRKVPDARYKLGTVLFQLGQKNDAKSMLQQVASGKGSAASHARDYLKANF